MAVYEGSDDSEGEVLDTKTPIGIPPEIPHPMTEVIPDYVSDDEDYPTLPKAPKIKKTPKPFKPFILGYTPEPGELCKEDERFCTFQIVKSYPYNYIGKLNRQRVDDTYFNGGKIYENAWEFFYLRRDLLPGHPAPLILVTTRQFNHFLARINKHFKIKLAIPDGAKGSFEVLFGEGDSPRPRYLGQANSKAGMDALIFKIPPRNFKLDGEPEIPQVLSDEAYEIFQNNVAIALRKAATKAASKQSTIKTRQHNQKSYRQTVKRVQRYLGLRKALTSYHDIDQKTVAAATDKFASTKFFDSSMITTFAQENSVIFVCVDVEAYERDSRVITEIGFATLDTKDILSMPPGERGTNWREAIRPRHFRISENRFYNNNEYVAGCADRFQFGTSEFIAKKDAPQIIADCFKYPLRKPGEDVTNEQPNRKIVFVGHDLISDIKFLRTVGFDVYTLPNLLDMVDTALIFRALKREMNTRSLGVILTNMGIVGWNLHNAGNDAVYTLQAMMAIAIKYLEEQQTREKVGALGSSKISSETVQEKDAWSSSGESDGGFPNIFFLPHPDYNYGKRTKSTPLKNSGYAGERNAWENSPTASSSTQAFEPKPGITHYSPRQW